MSSIEPFDPELKFYTVDKVPLALRVSPMTVYRLIKDGAVGAARVGRSIRIHATNYSSYIERLEEEATARFAR